MNYETFRNEFAGRLMDLPADQLQRVLAALDTIAAGYDISKANTDLTVYSDGIPEAVKIYIAAKAIQKMSRTTLANYSCVLSNFFRTVRLPMEQVTALLHLHLHLHENH